MNVRSVSARPLPDPASADPFLRATDVVDWTTPEIQRFARDLAGNATDVVTVAQACFEWVRDRIPHTMDARRDEVTCNASEVLEVGTGFCYAKSHLLVALLRANGVRAGFCYQRLARHDDGTGGLILHGLAAVDLGDGGWYRIDPRGNKPGVDAAFTPPTEQLAFPIRHPGEILFPEVYPDPAPSVLQALRAYENATVLAANLPDSPTAAALEA
jgi:transglutaminase-like putative cysteine protease